MLPTDLDTSNAATTAAASFASHLAAQRDAELPDWWLDAKETAWERFHALPYPTRLDERWRFSKLNGLVLDPYTLGKKTQADDAETPAYAHADYQCPTLPPFERAATLCFHGQTLVHGVGLPSELAERGVIFEPLTEALATHGDLLHDYFHKYPTELGSEKFTALNTALTSTGAVLYVPDGVEILEPFLVEHSVEGDHASGFPHTLVILGNRAKATLVEHFNSDTEAPQLISAVNDLHAAAGAHLTYIGVQDWSPAALALHSNSIAVGRDARVLSLNLHLGGAQVRHESHSRLLAAGAHSDMGSLSIAHGTQEYDQRTLQTHAAPHTSSDLLYKNALLGHAHTIFSGLIIVDPDAQHTDAYQSNRNLFLSPDAAADSLPGLEIQANDVRCTHGATNYRIDPEQLYYLHSRGIPTAIANEMLLFGFFDEVLDKLNDTAPALRAPLSTLIQNKFKEI